MAQAGLGFAEQGCAVGEKLRSKALGFGVQRRNIVDSAANQDPSSPAFERGGESSLGGAARTG
jgi:hypothetical protein